MKPYHFRLYSRSYHSVFSHVLFPITLSYYLAFIRRGSPKSHMTAAVDSMNFALSLYKGPAWNGNEIEFKVMRSSSFPESAIVINFAQSETCRLGPRCIPLNKLWLLQVRLMQIHSNFLTSLIFNERGKRTAPGLRWRFLCPLVPKAF